MDAGLALEADFFDMTALSRHKGIPKERENGIERDVW